MSTDEPLGLYRLLGRFLGGLTIAGGSLMTLLVTVSWLMAEGDSGGFEWGALLATLVYLLPACPVFLILGLLGVVALAIRATDRAVGPRLEDDGESLR